MTLRDKIKSEAEWGLANRTQFDYLAAPGRWEWRSNNCKFRIKTDCSGFATLVYFRAGAPDPSKKNFNDPDSYTGTLIDEGEEIQQDEISIGDLVLYFDGPGFEPSTGSHVAVIVQHENGFILTISHGHQGCPEYCWVGEAPKGDERGFPVDTRAHKFFSYLPAQAELLKEEQKPASEPVKASEAPEPAKVDEPTKEPDTGDVAPPTPAMVEEIAEGEKDMSGIMESPETPEAPGAI